MTHLRTLLASRIADPVLWKVVKRWPVLRRSSDLRQRQWDDVQTFERRQTRLLGVLLHHALENVPYYSERAASISPAEAANAPRESLGVFPALGRGDLREHAGSLTCEMNRGAYWNSTGGSTGEPVRFLLDRVYQTNALATTRLFYEWAGFQTGCSHIKLWGAPRDLGTGRIARRRRVVDWAFNRITLDAFDMSMTTMRRYAGIIADVRPVCLEGYVDALYELAACVEQHKLEMHSPGVIVSSAGTLLPHMREKIEGVFGAEVFDRYGTRELGGVAAECDRHEGLHVLGETCIVEIVDGDGAAVGEGEEGEVLVTNLHNYTMPLIRYRIGDRAVRGARRCSCGRPYELLSRVTGRTESSVVRADGGVVLPEFFIHAIGVEYNDGSIAKFQVVQETLDHIAVVIVPTEGAGDRALAHKDEMRLRIQKMVGDCRVSFALVDRIEPTPTGKHLYVISRVIGRRD